MSITELLNKRVLLKLRGAGYREEITEYKVLEVSPSGNWVKLQNMCGNKFWKTIGDIALVEVLQDLTPKPLLNEKPEN